MRTGMELTLIFTSLGKSSPTGMRRKRVHALLNSREPFKYFRAGFLHNKPLNFFTVTSLKRPEILTDQKEKEGEGSE